ncbi:MAG: hypothetical protein E7265_06755 [Lachnospiraceae bacterium]|nr:hypothetical protein [Lachnospiraceae bacterium]
MTNYKNEISFPASGKENMTVREIIDKRRKEIREYADYAKGIEDDMEKLELWINERIKNRIIKESGESAKAEDIVNDIKDLLVKKYNIISNSALCELLTYTILLLRY